MDNLEQQVFNICEVYGATYLELIRGVYTIFHESVVFSCSKVTDDVTCYGYFHHNTQELVEGRLHKTDVIDLLFAELIDCDNATLS